ncbi:MAG TPA: hypothetical protein VFX65_14155 [Candidatus Limnocylindrales bacterium]|nr:hypothetical protein [Candidatus Limnocylindrales bacterium]
MAGYRDQRARAGHEKSAAAHGVATVAAVAAVAADPARGVGPLDVDATTRSLVRSLERWGMGGAEAGNLVGLLHGLRPVRGGWSIHEIEHLRFLRALADGGRIEP